MTSRAIFGLRLRRKDCSQPCETWITTERIPIGTLLQFTVGDTDWKFDCSFKQFQGSIPLAAPGVGHGQVRHPGRPNPGILLIRKYLAGASRFANRIIAPAKHGIG